MVKLQIEGQTKTCMVFSLSGRDGRHFLWINTLLYTIYVLRRNSIIDKNMIVTGIWSMNLLVLKKVTLGPSRNESQLTSTLLSCNLESN
jgi:hypothetical protein